MSKLSTIVTMVAVVLVLSTVLGGGATLLRPHTTSAVPSGPDLDVTYIERTPRQARNCITSQTYNYPPGTLQSNYYIEVPAACDAAYQSNPSAEPHWPSAGSTVTLWGHIKNKGVVASSGGTYQWFLDDGDGEEAYGSPASIPCTTSPPCEIPVGEEVIVTTNYTWPTTDHATHEYPRFRLAITPSGSDGYTSNDSRTHYVLGKSLAFFVRQDWYDLWNTTLNGTCADTGVCAPGTYRGTYSYEDWLQRQITGMNDLMAASTSAEAPEGSFERMNLEKVVIVANDATAAEYIDDFEDTEEPALVPANPPKLERIKNYDSPWHQPGAAQPEWPPTLSNSWGYLLGVEPQLIHELSHYALGAIDMYNMPVVIKDDGTCTAGIMYFSGGGGSDPDCGSLRYEATHVLYFNKRLAIRGGFPGGYFGDFMLQTPDTNTIELKTSGGLPVPNVEVTVQQRSFHGISTYVVGHGRTDAAGRFVLPEQPSHVFSTQAGYSQPAENAFGNIHTWGRNGWLYLTFTLGDGTVMVAYLDKPSVVLEKERGNDPAYYGFAVDPPANGASPPVFSSLAASEGYQPLVRRIDAAASVDTNRVDFFVDGVLRGRDTTAPYQFDWDMRFERSGKHWITARALKVTGSTITAYAISPEITGALVQTDGSLIAPQPIDPASTFGTNLALTGTASASGVGTEGIANIRDGNVTTGWSSSGANPGDWVQIYLGASPQQVRGIRIRNGDNLSDQCQFDVYVTTGPPTADAVPVVSRRYTDLVASTEIAFPTATGNYVRIVCQSVDAWWAIKELEVYSPAPPPPAPVQISGLSASLNAASVGGVTQPATSASVTWNSMANASYYLVCTDSVATGSFATCSPVVGLVPTTSAVIALPVGDGVVTYVKVKACTAFDTCSALSTMFAAVGRVTTGSVDYVYALDSTQDDLRVQFSSLATSQPIRFYVMPVANVLLSEPVASVCADGAGWSPPAYASARLWKFTGVTFAVVHGVAAGSCAGTSTPDVSAGRSATFPARIFGPVDLTSTMLGWQQARIQWTPRGGEDHYKVCQGTTLYVATTGCISVSGTSYDAYISGHNYWWVSSCDISDACGPASRSFVVTSRPGGLSWTYYKTSSTFGYQAAVFGVATSAHVYNGASTSAPVLITTDCIVPGSISPLYTLPASAVTATSVTVSRHNAGGTTCPNDGFHSAHDLVITRLVRQLPAPALLDFSIDATGTAPNVYRTRLDWPDSPDIAHYRYCSNTTGPDQAFTCPPSLVIKRTFQHLNFPTTNGTKNFHRVVACDIDNYCSPMTTDYVQVQRAKYSYFWDFVFAYRRTPDSVGFQFANFSSYLGAPLWLKLHVVKSATPAEADIIAGMDTCARNSAGDGPISGRVDAPLSSFAGSAVLGVWNHRTNDPPTGVSCATTSDHTGDGDLGIWTGPIVAPSP